MKIPDKEWLTPEGARLARAERRAKYRVWLLPIAVLCGVAFYLYNR